MKRFIFSALTIGLILGFSGCSSSPEDSLVETMGGVDGFDKLMKSSGVTISAISIKNIAPIKKDVNILSSQITYTQTAKIHDEEMTMDSSFIASSKDDGKT